MIPRQSPKTARDASPIAGMAALALALTRFSIDGQLKQAVEGVRGP